MIVSARRGIQCYFDVDDITISVWGSAWTGREIKKVDDRVVSNKLSIRFSTSHDFEHQGHQYQVRFIIASAFTGLIRVELIRDGELVIRGTDRCAGQFGADGAYHAMAGRVNPCFARKLFEPLTHRMYTRQEE